MSQQEAQRIRRLLLYVHFDPHGKLDPHVLYQIRALNDFGMEIVFISNSPLQEADKDLLDPLTTRIVERPDEGYDWTAWKETLLEMGEDKIKAYSELVIMNDSTYGPFFPLDEMFDCMSKTGVDFWGITRDKDPYYGEHLQPYFCVFRPRLFNSPVFWNFWKNLPKMTGFQDAMERGELCMTRIFNEAGFLHGAYADIRLPCLTPTLGTLMPLVYTAAPWLISHYRAPFAKIKAFITWPGKQFNTGPGFFKALEDAKSPYPPGLVNEHLRRTRPLSWQKNLPGFLKAFPLSGSVLPDPALKIAVYAHLFYEDQFAEALSWLARIPYPFDLFISTSSEGKKEQIIFMLDGNSEINARKIEIRVFEDHGRDVLPWLIGFSDVQQKYDLALKFHLKKRVRFNGIFTKKWSRFILESTLGSAAYISHVITEFSGEQKLGLVFHPIPPALLMHCHAYAGDRTDLLAFDAALEACGIKTPVETSFPIFPQNIFWYRPRALARLFESGISSEDFPGEPFPSKGTIAHGIERATPYIASASGYKVCQIIPDRLLIESYQQYEDHLWHLEEVDRQKREPGILSPWAVGAYDIATNKYTG